MARLVNGASGVVVNVDDELAARLLGAGWSEADAAKKAPAKKAAAKKSES